MNRLFNRYKWLVGALALGVVAVLIKREFWLVLVGGVFVAEAV